MSAITLETVGRRVYVLGGKIPRKIPSRGGALFPEIRRPRSALPSLDFASGPASICAAGITRPAKENPASRPSGGAEPGGKTGYYYVLAQGTTAAGRPYLKLCFRDGSRVFWARGCEDDGCVIGAAARTTGETRLRRCPRRAEPRPPT